MSGGSWRLRTYPLAVLAALAAAVVLVVVTSDGAGTLSGRLGGDLPAFYGAGRIVADGDADQLYDPARQVVAQRGLWGDDHDTGILFAYPAVLAAPYAALTTIGYHGTYLVHTAVMVLAVVLAARLLVDRLPLLAGRAWIPLGLAVTFTFLPMFIGVANGQTTALTLLAAVAVWVCLSDGRDALAGVVAGLALLKPQYGGVLVALLVLGRRWPAVAGAAVGGGVVWLGSAAVAGLGWTGPWLDLVRSMSDIDQGSNLGNEVSWFGLAELILGQGSTVALVLGATASVLTFAVLVASVRGLAVADPRVIALVLPSLLLIAPHALYYDAGILLVSLVALLPTVPPDRRMLVLAVWWAAGFAHMASGALGFEPVALLVVATWAWAVWACRSDRAAEVHAGDALTA